jgi:hypothetical protein
MPGELTLGCIPTRRLLRAARHGPLTLRVRLDHPLTPTANPLKSLTPSPCPHGCTRSLSCGPQATRATLARLPRSPVSPLVVAASDGA